jgi:tRNA-specific 2-thiouridylase
MIHPKLDALPPNERYKVRVVVAMSGGVDSSVAAALLKQQGFNVIGMALKTYDLPTGSAVREKSCCSIDDMEDARRVCEKLEIPFYVMNTQEEFEAKVIDPFVTSYLEGRTPNPCINCNTFIKFDFLRQKAAELGADYVATGHYALLTYEDDGELAHLRRPRDEHKDQTYFLFHLTQEQLKRTLFPLGYLTKEEVRKTAANLQLPVAEKAESQEICFVDNNKYAEFIEKRVGKDLLPGGHIILEGKSLGQHEGVHRYTIGQRKGLNINEKDVYVSHIDAENNLVFVSKEAELYRNGLLATDVTWLVDPYLLHDRDLLVKVRSTAQLVPAKVSLIANNQVIVRFRDPQRALTPGQGLCIYADDEVLGGGWIDRTYLLPPPQPGQSAPSFR